ncbi:hypothetical protein [Serratia ureilytica]|uniref:hypothetical protein n=1 Tax=Serratia ureilytica TaxID=300181 RepID=UPI001B8E9FB8|nr:hypothetical protein [Serratia ureilytica]HBC5194909.1 hypothetical protein [Serratia marcescens]
MNVDQDDIDEIYNNLISIYTGGEAAIVSLFRSKSPTLRENMTQAMTEYDDEFTPEEQGFIFRALEQRIIAASQNIPLTLDNEQKKQVQRFYSTNSGASFINTHARNARLDPKQAISLKHTNIRSALNAAASEPVSAGQVAFSNAHRKTIEHAFMLSDVEKVMRAALSGEEPYYRAPQYRGTRVPKTRLDTFKVGDIMVNAFFASFSPDIMEYTKTGERKVHDGLKQAMKFTGGAYKSHVGVPVIYEIPERSGYKTISIDTLYERETVIPPGEKLEIEEIVDKGTYTHIRLKKVDAKKSQMRYMYY